MNAVETRRASAKDAPIIPLAQAGPMTEDVGAKAARLGALLAAGQRVPDGYCIVGMGEPALQAAATAYRALGPDAPVAVRSSASVEDASTASFAGQFETILNVRGDAELRSAIERCWASALGTRAQAYGQQVGSSGRADVRMAVLVQHMVDARVAGVAFSANPLTGARDEVVVEAVRGLGDKVASGEANVDQVVVPERGPIRWMPASHGDAVLTEPEAREIATLAREVAAGAASPQDIEWAIDESGVWLLQARPMTALPDAVSWESPTVGAKWVKDAQAAEWAHEPLSPLGAGTTFAAMVSAREQARGWPPAPKKREPVQALINGWLYMRADVRPITLVLNIVGTMLSLATGTLDGHRRVRRRWPSERRLLDAFEAVDLAALDDEAFRVHLDRLLTALGRWWMEFCWCTAVPRACGQLLAPLVAPVMTDTTAPFRANDSLMLEAQRALRRTAMDRAEVGPYLMGFGHLVESADPIHATLREAPEQLAWQLEAARRGGDPDERLSRQRAERAAAERAVRSIGGVRGIMARRLMGAGQSFAAHADDALFHLQRALAAIRAALLERGRRLVSAGLLDAADDVFFLQIDELWSPYSPDGSRERVAGRRQVRERQRRLAPPPFIPPISDPAWQSDPVFRRMPPDMRDALFARGLQMRDGRRVMVGEPASPGRAQGIARVVTGPGDFERFEVGDVLVAHATSPIWTPLLSIAAAAVTEVGGPTSHAAIVSREFGIPLVGGALEATRVIADGTPVVVDGSAGIVELGTTAP